MPLGPLNDLPLGASDFASVCFTASVPDRHVRLVVVRLVATTTTGSSTALLFDGRNSVSRLKTAVLDATRTTFNVSNNVLCRAAVYTRISGSIIPVTELGAGTVNEESSVAGGCLRGSLHIGNALRAYIQHSERKTLVCTKTTHNVLYEWQRTPPKFMNVEERHFAAMYLRGLRRTDTEICLDTVCNENSTCDCFMRNAIWRAGNRWLIVYVVLPPDSHDTVRHVENTTWLDKLIGTAVVAAAPTTTTSTLIDVVPSKWHRTTNEYIERVGVDSISDAVQLLLNGDDDDDGNDNNDDNDASESECESTSSTSSTSYCSMSLGMNNITLVEAATIWALRDLSDQFVTLMENVAASSLDVYYRVALQYVLAKGHRRRLVVKTLKRAKQLAKHMGDARIFGILRSCDDGETALNAVMVVINNDSSVTHYCEVIGYTLVVIVSTLICCQRLNDDGQRSNMWPAYVHVGVDSTLLHTSHV